METKMKFMELANSTRIEDMWPMDYHYNDPWCKKSTSLEMDSQYTFSHASGSSPLRNIQSVIYEDFFPREWESSFGNGTNGTKNALFPTRVGVSLIFIDFCFFMTKYLFIFFLSYYNCNKSNQSK